MQTSRIHLFARAVLLLTVSLFSLGEGYAQITPSGDSYTNKSLPTTNFGSNALLDVNGATQTTYIQFDLSSIPQNAAVSKATLKLYVNSVTAAGSFNVDFVNGTWSESTIDFSNAPALGTTIASSIPVTTASKNHYILVDITSALTAWLDNSQPNDGLALVANGTFNATFDSKENTTTSHAPELDVVFGGGTITGVLTGGSSGLTGGGTQGTLNLSLLTSCAASQVLQWTGSAWVCSSAGSGTITGVTAGTDLTGGGTHGTVVLNLDTTKVPQLAAPNNFTGNQTVNGNLSATGVVSGNSYQIGSNLFAFGSFANGNVFLGFAGNTTTTGLFNTAAGGSALLSNTTGVRNTATGNGALAKNTTGSINTADGEESLVNNTTGGANTATGQLALFQNTSGANNTGMGVKALFSNTTGSFNTAVGVNSGVTADNTPLLGSGNNFLGFSAALSTGILSNATAIGSNAMVAAQNAMVLGSINNVNGANADTLIGIGITAPTARLHIGNSGGGSYTQFVRIEGPATQGSGQWAMSVGGNGDFGVDAPGVVNGRFVVKDITGFVGIGTANPDNLLSVNGSADKPGGGSWGTFSDGRLKNVAGNFASGLDKVMKLHPVRYRYKLDNALGISDHEEHIGVVAQEVQRVLPEAVSANNKGYLLVNNDPIIWAMLNAIKEQQQQITAQQREIKAQRQEVRALRKGAIRLEEKLATIQRGQKEPELASVK